MVSLWEKLPIDDEYTKIIHVEELIASTLYEELPNVPVVAKQYRFRQG